MRMWFKNLYDHYEFLYLRFHLWRICRRLKIKPYAWQKEFAMSQSLVLNAPQGRQSGKTTAIMLKLLLLSDTFCFTYPLVILREQAIRILCCDPDFIQSLYSCIEFYDREYQRLCHLASVPVYFNIHSFHEPYRMKKQYE